MGIFWSLLDQNGCFSSCWVVQLLVDQVWLSGLVTGYYRNDDYYQLNFLESLLESGESKVMGEFCSTTWFQIDGGPKVEWRRSAGNLVTSRDVRNYLQPTLENKGKEKEFHLLGKAIKARSPFKHDRKLLFGSFN